MRDLDPRLHILECALQQLERCLQGQSNEAEVEVSRIAEVGEEAEAKRGTTLEDECIRRRQERQCFDDVSQDVVALYHERVDAVGVGDSRDGGPRDQLWTLASSSSTL